MSKRYSAVIFVNLRVDDDSRAVIIFPNFSEHECP